MDARAGRATNIIKRQIEYCKRMRHNAKTVELKTIWSGEVIAYENAITAIDAAFKEPAQATELETIQSNPDPETEREMFGWATRGQR